MSRRKRNNKKLRKAIAIIGEGISEKEYFSSLKQNERYSFKIKPDLPKNSDFIWSFKKAIDLVQKEDYDLVFCLIDLDYIYEKNLVQKFKKQRKELIRKIGNSSFKIIKSNPCFETWFLFHFLERINNYTNCHSIISELKKYSPFKKYDKSKKFFSQNDVYSQLQEKLDYAIKNSKKINIAHDNSFSEIYKIIEYFMKLGKK